MPDLPNTLLRWTRFADNPHGTGPEKRSAQLRALCEEAGFAVADMKPPASVPFWRTYPAGFAARWRFGRHAALYNQSPGLLGFFANFYRGAASPGAALGYNLFGAMVGGILEYASMAWGVNSLNLISLAAYAGVALFVYRSSRARVPCVNVVAPAR